ncbi:MAG: hypothetical protein GF341_10935, partial [candidate division Zixibacteria bacterium]|nr:hypothetical protein [candidate division Zixibacteria bacterium]
MRHGTALLFTLVAVTIGLVTVPALACTNFMVTKSASSDGSTMVTYT